MSILKVDQLQSRVGTDITLGNRLIGTQVDYSIMPSGSVIGMKSIRNSTRTSIGSVAAGYVLFSGTFTKQRADTIILATCTIFGAQYASGNCAVGLKLDNAWDYGVAYQYDGAWSSTLQVTMITGQCQWTGISIGSHTMAFGWNPATGGSGEKPFSIFNPNSSDDGRNQQMTSSINVYEVMP